MNELELIVRGNQILADSRNVAEMIGKEHYILLRDIDNYIKILVNTNLYSLETYFISSTYKDKKGEERRMFYLTKKGCDLVANKMTGEKGILFTAAYIDKFYQMEEELKQPIEKNPQLNLVNRIMNGLENNSRLMEQCLDLVKSTTNKTEHIQNGWDKLSDEFVNHEITYTPTEIAKQYMKPTKRQKTATAQALNNFLESQGVIKRTGDKHCPWELTAKYKNRGLEFVKTTNYNNNEGGSGVNKTIKWYLAGKKLIIQLLEKNGKLKEDDNDEI